MSVVDLSVKMRSSAVFSPDRVARLDGELVIRLAPLLPGQFDGIPHGHTWAWCVVLETPGDSTPDALICGGSADSQTGAAAQAHEEFRRQEARRAARKAG